jgi:hypothetical protein
MCVNTITLKRNKVGARNLVRGPYTKIVDSYQILDQIGLPELVLYLKTADVVYAYQILYIPL